MATYKGIKGVRIESLASDPPAATSIGEVWYNTATSLLKYSIEGAGSWSASNPMNTPRDSVVGTGTTTAALCAGGNQTAVGRITNTEIYDGTSWTEVAGNLLVATNIGSGFGTTTASVYCGGHTTGYVQTSLEWDGTSWTSGNNIVTARGHMGGSGTQAAGQIAGGTYTAPAVPRTIYALTESYNGSTWSEVGNIQTARYSMGSAGASSTAAFIAGGILTNPAGAPYTRTDKTETWNGSSWTEGNTIASPRDESSGCGTTTAGLITGGMGPAGGVALAETYNGTTWTEVADLGTPRGLGGMSKAGTTSSTIYFAGIAGSPTTLALTEEWADPVLAIKTVTTS